MRFRLLLLCCVGFTSFAGEVPPVPKPPVQLPPMPPGLVLKTNIPNTKAEITAQPPVVKEKKKSKKEVEDEYFTKEKLKPKRIPGVYSTDHSLRI